MSKPEMLLKCGKTGRLFFTEAEAKDHAEAFGAAYANFDEVSLDEKVWVCLETGRPCYKEADIARVKSRDPDSKTFEEKTYRYLVELQKKKSTVVSKKDRFYDTFPTKMFMNLTEVKMHTSTRAAKALHFTKSSGTLAAAEAWLAEHEKDADLETLTDEFMDEILAAAPVTAASAADLAAIAALQEEEEGPDERKVGDPNPDEIKALVNKDTVQSLIEMGFSELRAEKALYKTDSASLEHAVNWLGEHGEDADIDLPLRKPKPAPPPEPEKPKMSPEEAAEKAAELTKKLRAKKAEEEKLSAKEAERLRVESHKAMADNAEKLKDEEKKRFRLQEQREKEEHERHAAELKERLRLDYVERFGCEPPEEDVTKEVKTKGAKDQVIYHLNVLKKNYKDTDREGLKTCLSTLRVFVKNLQDNPTDLKYKKLKVDGKAFQARIAPFTGAMDFLDVVGFQNNGDVLEQRKEVPDGWLCGNAIKFIDLMLSQL